MASLNKIDIVSNSVARSLGNVSLESEQKAVIKDFVTGNDVFAVLTTGYGKSLCCDAPVDRDLFPLASEISIPQPIQIIAQDTSVFNLYRYHT